MINLEITNEIKANVFAQYLGKSFFNGLGGQPILSFTDLTDILLGKIAAMMILKPLSSITDEDAREVAKVSGHVFHDEAQVYFSSAGYFGVWIRNDRKEIRDRFITWDQFTLSAYQFLQSKGYDLPQYLLGGKTLKEAGLAIYKSEIK